MRPNALLTLAASLCAALTVAWSASAAAPARPNILFIVADDLGWHDVGYRGGVIQTPNIDRMAAAGARLEQFYTLPVCSPTRAALMTGRYPFRYGFQSGVNRPWSKWGLPPEERTLAEALHGAGYYTAITGKWHLGAGERRHLPTQRGFDHQYGQYTGAIDYFTHEREGGLDWHRNDRGLREEGYSTHLIADEAARVVAGHDTKRPLFLYVPFNAPHGPLQVPDRYVKPYEGIRNGRRRTYAGMVAAMDEGIGKILDALRAKGMTQNTLVVFSSDNGGPEGQGADNGPLRGAKHTLYEGGVRVNAWAVWPGKIPAGKLVNVPLHMTDWHPTLLKLVGASYDAKRLDGKDLWSALTANGRGRDEIAVNIEDKRAALRDGDWKLVMQSDGRRPRVELFDLKNDPNEERDLAAEQPERVARMTARIESLRKESVPALGGAETDSMPKGWKAPAVYGE